MYISASLGMKGASWIHRRIAGSRTAWSLHLLKVMRQLMVKVFSLDSIGSAMQLEFSGK